MAKKRGGGSNMGLIVTLIFFVLATLILGVTTYFGFADQEAMKKTKDDAVKKEKDRENERNWYRFQAKVLRQYLGAPPAGLDAKDLAREKGLFDKGQLTYASSQPDKEDFAKLIKELDKTMQWDTAKDDAPGKTVQTRLDEKDKAYAVVAKAAETARKEKEEAERQQREAQAALGDEKKNFDAALAKMDLKVKDDLKQVREQVDQLQNYLRDKGKEKEGETLKFAEASKKLDALGKKYRDSETRVATSMRDLKDLHDTLDEARTKLSILQERTGADLSALEAQAMDKRSKEVLKSWTKNWQVVRMDRRGTMAYINLGSSDGLQPQVTFSIHALGLDGKLNPSAKGTLEVVKVIDPHLALTRVTSTKDARTDPIMKGDRIYNPTWDPNRPRRIALAGIADLGGDGTDNTEDFRRLLSRQGVVLDAYVDTKDDKAPKVVGKGVTVNTDFLVLADPLEAVNHPKARNPEYVKAFDRLVADLKLKANTMGVTVVPLRKYLDMIGYRAPKVVSSNPANGYGR
jgi:hypothetical protein